MPASPPLSDFYHSPPFPSFGQHPEDLGRVISIAFQSPCFTDFVPSNQGGEGLLYGISTNNQIPRSTVIPFSQPLALDSRFAKKQEPRYWVRLEKVRLKPNAAKVFFVYDKTVKAKMWLHFKEGKWKVKRSMVRQKVKNKTGKQGSRFCMSF